MLYKIEAGDIWLIILLMVVGFGVLVTVISLWGNAFSSKSPGKKRRTNDLRKKIS